MKCGERKEEGKRRKIKVREEGRKTRNERGGRIRKESEISDRKDRQSIERKRKGKERSVKRRTMVVREEVNQFK